MGGAACGVVSPGNFVAHGRGDVEGRWVWRACLARSFSVRQASTPSSAPCAFLAPVSKLFLLTAMAYAYGAFERYQRGHEHFLHAQAL